MSRNHKHRHSDHWQTPPEFYKKLNSEFKFDFDPCPLFAEFDGLTIDWGERNFINPPYSRLEKQAFVEKAIDESKKGKLCVMLIPVSTSSKLFHHYIKINATEIRFIEGRLHFMGYTEFFGKRDLVPDAKEARAMHDSMIVVFDGRKDGNQGIS